MDIESVLVENKLMLVILEIFLSEYSVLFGIVEFMSGWGEIVCYIDNE